MYPASEICLHHVKHAPNLVHIVESYRCILRSECHGAIGIDIKMCHIMTLQVSWYAANCGTTMKIVNTMQIPPYFLNPIFNSVSFYVQFHIMYPKSNLYNF